MVANKEDSGRLRSEGFLFPGTSERTIFTDARPDRWQFEKNKEVRAARDLD